MNASRAHRRETAPRREPVTVPERVPARPVPARPAEPRPVTPPPPPKPTPATPGS